MFLICHPNFTPTQQVRDDSSLVDETFGKVLVVIIVKDMILEMLLPTLALACFSQATFWGTNSLGSPPELVLLPELQATACAAHARFQDHTL